MGKFLGREERKKRESANVHSLLVILEVLSLCRDFITLFKALILKISTIVYYFSNYLQKMFWPGTKYTSVILSVIIASRKEQAL